MSAVRCSSLSESSLRLFLTFAVRLVVHSCGSMFPYVEADSPEEAEENYYDYPVYDECEPTSVEEVDDFVITL